MTQLSLPPKGRWAAEYLSAPINRFNTLILTLDTGTVTEITAQCPTFDECGDAGSFDVMVSFIGSVDGAPVDSNLELSVVVTDDAAEQGAVFSYTGDEETDGIRVRGLFPRDPDTGLLTVPDFPGTTNQLFIRNDSPDELTVLVVFEIPILDWRPLDPLSLSQGERQRWAIEYEAAPGGFLNNETITVPAGGNVEITDRIPIFGNDTLRSPCVDLFVTQSPLLPATPVLVTFGAVALSGGYFPAPGSLLVNPVGGAGHLALTRVRRVRPRLEAGGTLIDGNRLWLVNQDGGNQVDATVAVRLPLLSGY